MARSAGVAHGAKKLTGHKGTKIAKMHSGKDGKSKGKGKPKDTNPSGIHSKKYGSAKGKKGKAIRGRTM